MNKYNLCINKKVNPEADYFFAGPNTETNKASSAKTTIRKHNEFCKVFTDIGYFKGTFLLKVKEDTKLYQAPPGHVAYALQTHFKKLERLQGRKYWCHQG